MPKALAGVQLKLGLGRTCNYDLTKKINGQQKQSRGKQADPFVECTVPLVQ
jgi:hypothetical protein